MRTLFAIATWFSTGALLLSPGAGWAQDPQTLATFALGRGGAAAKTAVDVQYRLRLLADELKLMTQVDLTGLLDPDGDSPRAQAVEEARALLVQGKQAYEQLELEDAQARFQQALKKFEYGFTHLSGTGHLVEVLMYLGASYVLMGEPDQAQEYFARASDLPGRKTMSDELFPPNIQEVYTKTSAEAREGPRAKASLLSVPDGAIIFIDDSYRGGSPLQIDDLRPGDHLVTAFKDGFRPWAGKIKVTTGRPRRLKLTLKPAAKRKPFSDHFRKLAVEVFKGEPAAASQALAGFLGAGRLAIVVLEGEPAAMTMRGLNCSFDPQARCAETKEVLDTTSPGYPARLRELLTRVLKASAADEFAEPDAGAGDSFDAGAADAARLLAEADRAGQTSDSLGLDLGDDSQPEKPAGDDQPGPESDPDLVVAQAVDDDVARQARKEQTDQTDQADKVVKNAARSDPDPEQAAAFSWGYLHDKWWFWTAIGVVVAGAATGTAFALTGGQDSGGELVLGLH